MLLEFTVYFARSLGDAEEKAKKIIRDYLGKHNGCEYTLEVLNVSGHAADLEFETYVFNVAFHAVERSGGPYLADALRLVD